jgi:hypothetical protein
LKNCENIVSFKISVKKPRFFGKTVKCHKKWFKKLKKINVKRKENNPINNDS